MPVFQNVWTGAVSTDFDTAANWSRLAVPQAGDDVVFKADLNGVSVDCDGMHAASGGAYGWVLVDASYTKTVTLASGFATGTLTMAGGTIDQPATLSSTDITVNTVLNWTGGTLNSTSNLASVILDGATATIAPLNGGTLNLGSNLSLINAAAATMEEGEVDVANDGQIDIDEDSELVADPGAYQIAAINVQLTGTPQINLGSGGILRVQSGEFTNEIPLKITGGSLIIDSGTVAAFAGRVDDGNDAPTVQQTSGGTYIAADGTLDISGEEDGYILMSGGVVSIACGEKPEGFTANIIGNLALSGANIEYDAAGGPRNDFGQFWVNGDVTWTAGTYYHYVYAPNTNYSDYWTISGTFTIGFEFGGGGPSIQVTAIDENDEEVVPNSNMVWKMLGAEEFVVNDYTITTGWSAIEEPLFGHALDVKKN